MLGSNLAFIQRKRGGVCSKSNALDNGCGFSAVDEEWKKIADHTMNFLDESNVNVAVMVN